MGLRIGSGHSVIISPEPFFYKGTSVFFLVNVTDNLGTTDTTLELTDREGNHLLLPLDANGRAEMTFSSDALYDVVARAHDAAGNVGEARSTLRIVDPVDHDAPVVAITSPAVDAAISQQTDVYGTVTPAAGHQLDYWQVLVARPDKVDLAQFDIADPDYQVIGRGTTAENNEKLATFDPTLLNNDGFVIVLVAFDASGIGNYTVTEVNVEGNLKLGQFRQEFTDLSIPLAGIPITITRVYYTRQAADKGDFGYGWTLGIRDAQIRETAAVGVGGALVGDNTFIPGKTKVYLTDPSGQRVGFTYQERPAGGSLLAAYYQPYFTPDPGVYDTLEVDGQVVRGGVFGELVAGINPDDYTLTTPDGTRYRYNQAHGLQSISDPNGNVLTFKDDGIYVGSTREVTFERDGAGRIKQITYPMTEDGQTQLRSLDYTYDAAGNLVAFHDQQNLTTTFSYKPTPAPEHYLDEIHDPLGRLALKTEYDENGRIVKVTDANGNDVTYDYSQMADNVETVRDQNGNPTLLSYNDRGNVTRKEVRDAADNVLGVTLYDYTDAVNPDKETTVTQVRGDGLPDIVTSYTYDHNGNTTTITDSLGTRTFAYNSLNSVTQVTDELGHQSIFHYDAGNNLNEVVNAAGETSGINYDAQGRPLTYTDFRGNTTTFDYLGSQTQPSVIHNAGDGSLKKFQYNEFGQVTRSEDEAGVVTTYKYDNLGRLTEERMGADARIEYQYTGQYKTKQIVHQSEVDPTQPDLVTQYGYYDTGLLKFQVAPAGHVTGYRYDQAGNQTMLGTWATKADFDLEDMSPSADSHLTFTHATFQHKFYYDGANRVAYEVDDYALSLPAASDADRIKTSYHYDQAGNRDAIIDADGRERTFEYDDRRARPV